MHSYSIDTNERSKVIYIITILSVALSYSVIQLLKHFNIVLPDWASAPSPALFFAFIFWVFDNYLWKLTFFRRWRMSQIPVLCGTWSGVYVSSYIIEEGEGKGEHATGTVEFIINQSWTKIQLTSHNSNSRNNSTSYSHLAHICINDPHGATVNFMYMNEVENGVIHDRILDHKGFSIIRYSPSVKDLNGIYFNHSRDRKTHGSVRYMLNDVNGVQYTAQKNRVPKDL